ncbi:unnamed protein product [Brassica rapa subsp. trilocularis]
MEEKIVGSQPSTLVPLSPTCSGATTTKSQRQWKTV